ncbi:hypothetical protein LTR08_001305 [Meristemomyces frigidus]|nr:hypothetical protein LTR08_001305 [Meristemomyces frigidus]
MRNHSQFDRTSISAVDTSLKLKNKVHEMAQAERFFASECYAECAQICYEVLRAEPSEAIQARCHMYLATEAVGSEEAAARAYYAGMALQMWKAVIERTRSSRFPIGRAKVQFAFTQKLLQSAEAKIREEHTPLPDEEAIGVEAPDVEMSED